ncbi:helix-turn-helix domain-containing protein [Gordonibacter sp.]|nr:helix-turn-helix domain-containing protein [Gordonibacter sp.]
MPAVYSKGVPVEAKRIYLMRLESANDERVICEDILSIICCESGTYLSESEALGRPQRKGRTLYLEVPDGGLLEVCASLLDLFHREGVWREALWRLHQDREGSTIKNFLDASVDLFDGMLVYYPAGEWRGCVFSTADDWKATRVWGLVDEDGRYSEEIDYSCLEEAIGSTEPLATQITDRFGDVLDVLAVPVRVSDGSCLGLLLVPLPDGLATEAQTWHLSQLRVALEAFLNTQTSLDGKEIVSPHSLLKLLLSDKTENLRSIKRHLKAFGFPHCGNYACAIVDLNTYGSYKTIPLQQNCAIIEGMGEGYLTVQHESDVFVLADLSRCKPALPEFFQKVVKYYSAYPMQIGVSFPFSDLLQVGKYVQQAKAALELGAEAHPSRKTHWFTDVAATYILLHGTERLPARMLCSPGVLELQKQSDSGGVDYLETLTSYIENLYNASLTAKALHIHRSTLQYRLERIAAITELNLEDPDDRLYLEFSLALLRQR